MNTSTSEYSGACESGWTMYLDQYSSHGDDDRDDDQCNRRSANVDFVDSRRKQEYEYEDEDMLSDASSGPPKFHQQENYSEESIRYSSRISVSGQKQGKHRKGVRGENVQLDDTASSPVQTFSKNNTSPNKGKFMVVEQGSGFSQGFSATHYKGKSVLKKHFGFLKKS